MANETTQLALKVIEYGSQFWNEPVNDNFKATADFINKLAKDCDFDYTVLTADELSKLNGCKDIWALVVKSDKFCVVSFAAMMPVTPHAVWTDVAKIPQSILGSWTHTENMMGNRYQSAFNPDNGKWENMTADGQVETDGTIQVFLNGQTDWAFGYQGLAFLHN